MKCELIESERAKYPVKQLCRVLEISQSHYYRWRSGWISRKAQRDAELAGEVKRVFDEHQKRYGNRRIVEELQRDGFRVGRHRVARLMRENCLKAKMKRRFRITTDSNHGQSIAPNILEQRFDVDSPNQVWAGDVTYLRTTDGWLYLAVIIDLCSRKVVGWSMNTRLKKELCLDALQMALWRRRPDKGLLHHSDRGSQYTSSDYREALEKASVSCSMSRRGNCWDNAVVESFFSTLKRELFLNEPPMGRLLTSQAVFEYIEAYYNRKRRHSTLGYLTPEEYERQVLTDQAAKCAA